MSALSRTIVIDDTDPRVVYSENWFQDAGADDAVGNFGPSYLSTRHGTQAGILTFTFNGTGVELFGTNNVLITADQADPVWQCTIDDTLIQPAPLYSFPQNNWSFCNTSGLPDELHTFRLLVNATSRNFWVDSLEYTPSSSVSLDPGVVKVKHNDLRLSQDGQWSEYGKDAVLTQVSKSTMEFSFTGHSLSWYGTIPKELPHAPSMATYVLDGGAPVTITLKGMPDVAPLAGSTQFNSLFFQTEVLDLRPHHLVVYHNGTTDQTPLSLSHLLITTNSTAYSAQPSSSPTKSSSPPENSSNSSSSSSSSKFPLGAIVGIIIAVIALLALLLVGLHMRRRRGRGSSVRVNKEKIEIDPYDYDDADYALPDNNHNKNTTKDDISTFRRSTTTSGLHDIDEDTPFFPPPPPVSDTPSQAPPRYFEGPRRWLSDRMSKGRRSSGDSVDRSPSVLLSSVQEGRRRLFLIPDGPGRLRTTRRLPSEENQVVSDVGSPVSQRGRGLEYVLAFNRYLYPASNSAPSTASQQRD